MSRDLKALLVVVLFTGIVYWGVEPFAHSVMHKHVEGNDFKYSDIKVTAKGDPAKGKAAISACIGCHSIESQGIKAPMDPVTAAKTYGVNPPDLSKIGAIMDEKFLTAFIMDPAHAGLVKKSGMPAGMAGSEQGAADIAAYLKSIAPKEVSNKEAFIDACGRCHAMRYDKWTQIGQTPKFKPDIKTGKSVEEIKFQEKVAEYQSHLAKYLGKLPPDLSMIIRARSKHYLETFVENPQAHLKGTAMPRVGVTKEGYEKIEKYLESVGDSKKEEREALGPWVIGYFVIFALLAYGWYRSQWKDLH